MWIASVLFAIGGLSVLVIVWGIRRLRALPAPGTAQVTSGLRSPASIGAILGGLAILLGLMWWVVFVGFLELRLFDNQLGNVVVPLAGLVLSGVGLALSIKARGGAIKRQAIVGQVLNLLALLILAYPVLLLLLMALLAAFDIPVQ